MALLVWLPLNGDLKNNGLKEVNITAIEATPIYVAGKIGQCYQRANVNTQLTNGLKIDDNFLTTFGTLASVAVWVKPLGTHTHYNGTILSSGNWNAKKWAFGVSQDNSKVDVLCGAYNNYINCPVPINTWTHLVSTFDNGVCKLYKNGVYIGEKTGLAAFDSDADWTGICRESYAGGYFGFNGLINDLRIYDHCLSPKEVKEISKGLILHYPLDSLQVNPVNNLVTGVTAGGQTTKLTDGRIGVITSGTNADTYFTINLSENIIKDTKYTLICYAEGISAGAYWGFPLGAQNNSTLPFKIYNGYNEYTFVANDINWGTSRLFMDDLGRADWANRATFWGFQLYKNPVFNIIDESGYGHHGISKDCTLLNDTLRYERSILCLGTTVDSSSNTLTGAQYFYGLLPMPASSALTVAWWGKNTTYGRGGIFETTASVLTDNGSIGTDYNTTAIANWDSTFRIYNGSSAFNFYSNFSKDNNWHHRAIIFDAVKGYYYEDGILKNSAALTGTLPAFNSFRMGLGRAGGVYRLIVQSVSDLRIYATALSADDVKELYNTPAFIDNKLNLSAYELIEDNNAEVRKTGILEGVAFYESGTDALHYDTKIYTEPDGSKWAHIAHHNNPAGGVFPSNSQWNLGVYVDTNRWYDVELIVAISDKYEFMVKQKPTNDGTEVKYRWILTVSPLTATWNDVKPGTVTNIITSGYTNGGNGGMYISNNKTHICIANSSSGNWWGGIGTYTVYQGGIPGYPSVVVTTGYEDLYIRIYPEVLIYNSGQIKSNTFYEI